MKKFLAVVLSVMMMLTVMGTVAFAENTVFAKIGEEEYTSVAAAIDAAYNAGITDVEITLTGDTTSATTDSIDIYGKYGAVAFDNITIKQEDSSKAYYLQNLFTGWRTDADGKFVFDGVNIVVTGQYMCMDNVELINGSTINRPGDVTNFVFDSNMYIEPGSKYLSLVDRVNTNSILIVDGGNDNGSINSNADLRTVWLYVDEGTSMTIKNGAYVLVSNYEYAELYVNGEVNVNNSRLDVFTGIRIGANASFKVDAGSTINTKEITGTGTLIIDAAGMDEGVVEALKNVKMSGFTGDVELTNAFGLEAKIVGGKIEIIPDSNLEGYGTWGGIDWTLDKEGTLTIAPTAGTPVADTNSGKTYEVGEWREAVRYDSKGEGKAVEGWPYDRAKVKKLVIKEGVTSIGSFAAQGFANLTGEVVIPSTVTYIGQEAFMKSTFTKLTFAEGGTEELCIAQGAFKNLVIEEVALPVDRAVHLHAWVFNNCHNLKKATLPASLVSVHGTNHIDYNKNFEEHSNPTWTKTSEIFAYNENMEVIEFGSEEVKDMFFTSNNGTKNDYMVATTDRASYSSLEDAFANVADGETITLLKNVTLNRSISFAKDIEFTLNGNGKKITPAAGSTEANCAFNFGQGSDATRAARKYNIKNVTFEGWTTDHVVRLQGTTSVVENCTFVNNNQPDGLGLMTLTFADATVKNCTFKNNTCVEVIDVNSWGDNSKAEISVENCVFENNTCTGNAVMLVSDGHATTVKDSKFVENKVNADINGATLYLGSNTGIKAIGNYFKDNAVVISSTANYDARPLRSAAVIVAAFKDDNCAIEGNAFDNNTLKIDDEAATTKAVAYNAQYAVGDISGNYWGAATAPAEGVDYSYDNADKNLLVLRDYYTVNTVDANNDFALSGLVNFEIDMVLDFVNVTPVDAEGEKVYDININASELIINRLNSVDLTFIHQELGGNTKFEIIASNPEVVINPVNNSKERYEFHYNGKTDVATDTARTITIGRVKFTGYGSFNFAVNASVDTNVAHATKIENNIVDTYVPGGNTELNYGKFDVSDKDITGVVIEVPKRNLTVEITFPNAIEYDNSVAYQDMKVTIVGGNQNIEVDLAAEADYTFTKALPYETAYTVTVSGAGYRTATYTVQLTEDKTLNFWNNVMDRELEVEVKNSTSKTVKNFLAGDIVGDDEINIYDLSAAVSYFGTNTKGDAKYSKYDLNRDGKIDSKDVAFILVSWGE